MNVTIRNNEVDFVRMAALVGICIVNVPFLALPTEAVFISPSHWLDKTAAFWVECFFQLKFFILFSFIFGWGMFVQERSAAAKKQSFKRLYFRRMFGLAIFGIAHALLVFSGDILLLYALLGLFLWLVKNCEAVVLLKIAGAMVFLSMVCLVVLAFVIESMIENHSAASLLQGDSIGGHFWELCRARFANWPGTFLFLLLLQGPLAFAAFVTGLAAAKTNFFAKQSAGFIWLQKNWVVLLLVALPLNAMYAAVTGGFIPPNYELTTLLGFVLIAVGAPALSAVYLYVFIQCSRKLHPPELWVLAGRNSLSSYVAQGLIAGFIFGAYGLGIFNRLGQAQLLPVSVSIALCAVLLVGTFAKFFGRGPLEPILRWITQGNLKDPVAIN